MHDASHITFRGLDRKLTLAHHDTIKYLSKTLYGCSIPYGSHTYIHGYHTTYPYYRLIYIYFCALNMYM